MAQTPHPPACSGGLGRMAFSPGLGCNEKALPLSLLPTQNPWLCGLLRAGGCPAAANHRPGGLSPGILIVSLFSLFSFLPSTALPLCQRPHLLSEDFSCLLPSWPPRKPRDGIRRWRGSRNRCNLRAAGEGGPWILGVGGPLHCQLPPLPDFPVQQFQFLF